MADSKHLINLRKTLDENKSNDSAALGEKIESRAEFGGCPKCGCLRTIGVGKGSLGDNVAGSLVKCTNCGNQF